MTVPPLIPRDPSPRRRRRGGPSWLPFVLVAMVIAVVAVGGLALVTRRPKPYSPATVPSAGPPSSAASSTATPAASISPAASPAAATSPAASPSSPSASPPTPAARPLPPLPQFVASPQPVPVIVYHHIMARPKGPALVVMSIRLFEAQMAWLSAHGYQAVTLRRVYDAWTGQGILPPHPVVLSFDDGYADQVRNAAPVLRRYHWPAELDLVSSGLYVGDSPPAISLTPEMVQGLLDDGWGLESHSASHLDLTRVWGTKLHHELVDSRTRLEQLFDVKVDFFCFPGGIYNRRVKLAVRRAGYLAATGTRYGAATPRDLFSLPRIYAYKRESMRSFGSRLREILAAAGS